MKKTTLIALAALALLVAQAPAHDYKLGALQIDHPWARATPKGASVGGAYLKITNTGAAPDRLLGGSSPIAGRVEIHEMTMDQGVMRMRPLKDGVEIKPGQTVELKPGSFHVMLIDLKQPIKENERVKGTLIFEKAGTVEVEYAVVPVGGSPGGNHGAAAGHGH